MNAATLSPPALAGAVLRTTSTRPLLCRSANRLTTAHHNTYTTSSEPARAAPPRWAQTPAAMAMPVRTRPGPRARQSPPFTVNTTTSALDAAYLNFLGRSGDTLLPEELKWLAVTHKSFDHARRGFNDKLAFLGKRIVDVQCDLGLLQQDGVAVAGKRSAHPALRGLENVTGFAKTRTLDKSRLAGLARQYGIDGVVRWKPRNVDNLQSSGVDVVLAHTLYSIVGAVAMEKGGEFANKIVKERILSPLGLK